MSKDDVQKFTRLRELAEDWEEIYNKYPCVRRLADECARARIAIEMINDAIAPAVYCEWGPVRMVNREFEMRQKISAVQSIIDNNM